MTGVCHGLPVVEKDPTFTWRRKLKCSIFKFDFKVIRVRPIRVCSGRDRHRRYVDSALKLYLPRNVISDVSFRATVVSKVRVGVAIRQPRGVTIIESTGLTCRSTQGKVFLKSNGKIYTRNTSYVQALKISRQK